MTVGEAFLSAFLQVLFDRLASREFMELLRGRKLDEVLEKLKITLLTITAVLNDAEEKQFSSPAVEKWLHMAQDALFDAEDVLDELATDALQCQLEGESQTGKTGKNLVRNRSFIPSSVNLFKEGMESKIKKIIDKLENISRQKHVLGLTDTVAGSFSEIKQRLPTTSLVEEPCVYGRRKDAKHIIDVLLRDECSDNAKIGVFPIVGMGGIGKTVLAQLVYNNGSVKEHFDLRIWVCVTDQFDVMRITKTLVESITLKTSKLNDFNLLQVSLREKLVGKRFLLVLDDVWRKRNKGWDVLLNPLRAGAPGSRILVTTRNADVAASVGTVPVLHLKGLSFEDCWSLFKSQAFEERKFDNHSHLEVIGKEIVKKCDGLPLAAKRLGVLLRTRVEEHEWRDILNKKIWDLPDDEREILQTLILSYDHLPAHLKQCFAYCEILPEDYEFDKDLLVLLWIAEGFVQQPKGDKRLEEAGGAYFQDLVSRSFFQQSTNDKSSCFVMHGLMKDLAEFVSQEKCFRLEDKLKDGNPCKVFGKARYSSYIRGKRDGLTKFEVFNGLECLRSFLPLDPTGETGVSYLANKVPSDLLPKLRCLRVLSLNGYRITELPDSIGNLRHLRYLDLSHTAIECLPESSSTLYNLQTLILLQCHSLSMLPTNMGNLTNLRHLYISETRLKMMPLQMHRLTSLQTLSHFVVGKNGGSGIGALRNMAHLQGKLVMTGLQHVVSFWDAAEANLKDKHELDELVFQWSNNYDDITKDWVEEEVFDGINVRGKMTRFPSFREVMEAYEQETNEIPLGKSGNLNDSRHGRVDTDVLEMLQPHNNIKRLAIKDYRGTRFPGWVGNASYSNIIRLKLSNCKKCKCLPSLGKLQSLVCLTIKGMDGIKMVGTEFYHDGCFSVVSFPSLETLKFKNMLEWELWSSSGVEHLGDFHYLQKIEINDCPKLKKLSHHFPSLKKMSILQCQQLEELSTVPALDDTTKQGGDFPCLLELSIRACPSLRELPDLFPSLEILDMDGCLELAALPRLPKIRELELVKCDEGMLQSVAKFTSLTSLHLSHICKIEFLPEGFFHHLTALEELQISYFSELITLSNEIELQNVPFLKRLKISGCPNLGELPQNLHSLVSLMELKVWKCPHLVSFPETGLPSMLRILEIKDCEALEGLPEWIIHNHEGNNKNAMSILLEYFVIEGCSSLKCLPRGKLPSTLKKLEIQNCMNLESLPEDMTSVQFFNISECCSIVSFPRGGLHTVSSSNFMLLKKLTINKCMNLESLPEGLHNLMYLDCLEIAECPLLFSFPEARLSTKLRTLKISNCINFKSLPDRIYNLTSLQELFIDGCCSLVSLPEGGLPNGLIVLSILDCKNLKPSYDWGLHRLTSLNHFSFGGCPDLMSLPEEWLLPTTISSVHLHRLPRLKSLPAGLQNLKSLEKLEMWECGNRLTLPEEGQSNMQWNLQFWDVL